jgi:magnesium transporter
VDRLHLSGISGVLVPVTPKKVGADPATASGIVINTATDMASMGMLPGLAAAIVR